MALHAVSYELFAVSVIMCLLARVIHTLFTYRHIIYIFLSSFYTLWDTNLTNIFPSPVIQFPLYFIQCTAAVPFEMNWHSRK